MILADASSDTSVQVTMITTIGLVLIAVIGGGFTWLTSRSKKEAKTSSEEASNSAQLAKDYAAAVGGKDALIGTMDQRLKFVEAEKENCTKRLDEVERRLEEDAEAKRAAALLERQRVTEIEELREEIRLLKSKA